ncbi:hypothetical protein PAXRUDRAFT_830290 [Paxillus rubicundulus Ve08.2h10]|uniref:Uncharacterized protein n=1 Tax=Paxillus rubicundulus Ve08.2h10 TaxID=930991 RepID=A0A0D0D5T9_9AGAM|nr:hypothetical protein PAXRUDRAFT_830290 [Paxillus rubicundulus Ve08.2h10]
MGLVSLRATGTPPTTTWRRSGRGEGENAKVYERGASEANRRTRNTSEQPLKGND